MNRSNDLPGLRVLLVSPLPPPLGGHTVWTSEFVETASSFGVRTHVIDTSPGGDRINATSRVRVARVLQMVGTVGAFWRGLPDSDVAHLTTTWFWSLAREGLLARLSALRGVPRILHVHAATIVVTSLQAASKPKRLLLRWWLRPFPTIIVLSEDLRVALQAVLPKQNVQFVPNWVNTARFRPNTAQELAGTPRPHSPLHVIFVGRLTAEKGFLNLAEAVLQTPGIWLTAVGDRPERTSTQDSIDVANAIGRLEETGRFAALSSVPRDDMPALFRSADVFSLPSWNEGLPISLLEAMATALPCVITPVGGMGDLLRDRAGQPFAIEVPAMDTEALQLGLLQLLNDAELRHRLGQSGQQTIAERFSANSAFTRLVEIYQQVR